MQFRRVDSRHSTTTCWKAPVFFPLTPLRHPLLHCVFNLTATPISVEPGESSQTRRDLITVLGQGPPSPPSQRRPLSCPPSPTTGGISGFSASLQNFTPSPRFFLLIRRPETAAHSVTDIFTTHLSVTIDLYFISLFSSLLFFIPVFLFSHRPSTTATTINTLLRLLACVRSFLAI